MFKIGLGQSVQHAAAQYRQQLGRLTPRAGIVFAGIDFNHELMEREICRINR